MKRWLMLVALAVWVSGCQSISNPVENREKEKAPEFGTAAPNGEASPFGP